MRRVLTFCLIAICLVPTLYGQSDSPNDATPTETPENQPSPVDSLKDVKKGEEDTSRITDLPLLEEMTIPSASELLTGQKVTWIILDNQRVVVSRPVQPRPRTLEIQAKKLFDLRTAGIPGNPAKRAAFEQQVYELRRIRGGFIDAVEAPEFLILTSRIDKIWHHEDLLLKRAELLIKDEKYPEAYELLFTLRNIDSNWPGLAEAHHQFLFLNASHQLELGETQFAYTKFEQLHSLDPDYPELTVKLELSATKLIDRAVAQKDYRQARHFLNRLEKLLPQAQTVSQQSARLKSLSGKILEQAAQLSKSGQPREAARLAREAMEIWPYAVSLNDKNQFNSLLNNYQVLRVGVLERPQISKAGRSTSAADMRSADLTSRSLFEVQRFDDSPHYGTSFIEQWEPTDLGRTLDLRLQPAFSYWSSQKPVTALELASRLRERVDEKNPRFNERLSGFIERIEVLEPYRLEIRFRRTPLSPEAILSIPLDATSTDGGPFTETAREQQQVVFSRSIPEPLEVPQRHVAEILELSYKNQEEILRGMFRGEIDYIPDLSVYHASRVEESQEWNIRKYQIPQTHVLQFRQSSLLGLSSELRSALLYAIDREELLSQQILRGAPKSMARLTTSICPQQSRAFSPLVEDISPDPLVARSLTLAAQKAAGGKLPIFRMSVPHDPTLASVLEQMRDDWKRVGITVEIVAPDDPHPENWDIAYRIVSLKQPLAQLWPFLTMQSDSRVADLQILPGWLRQELIQLELATNWSDARNLLHKLHESLWKEVFYLPLWEVDRFSMSRRNLSGLPEEPLTPYQDVNRWVVNPWFDQSQP